MAAWRRETQSKNSRSAGRSGFALHQLCWRACIAYLHDLLWKLLRSHKYFENKKELWILMDLPEIFMNLMLWDIGCMQNTGWIKGSYSFNSRNRLWIKMSGLFFLHCVKSGWMGPVSNLKSWCVKSYYKFSTIFFFQ